MFHTTNQVVLMVKLKSMEYVIKYVEVVTTMIKKVILVIVPNSPLEKIPDIMDHVGQDTLYKESMKMVSFVVRKVLKK